LSPKRVGEEGRDENIESEMVEGEGREVTDSRREYWDDGSGREWTEGDGLEADHVEDSMADSAPWRALATTDRWSPSAGSFRLPAFEVPAGDLLHASPINIIKPGQTVTPINRISSSGCPLRFMEWSTSSTHQEFTRRLQISTAAPEFVPIFRMSDSDWAMFKVGYVAMFW
jgi:hypothetical protein